MKEQKTLKWGHGTGSLSPSPGNTKNWWTRTIHERGVSVPGANTPMCRTPLLLQSSSLCCASAIPAYQKPAEIT